MKTVAYFASTPYQVLTAIIMRRHLLRKEYVDLYIYDYFRGADKLAARIEISGVFRNVKVCKVKNIYQKMIDDRLYMVKNYVFCRKFAYKYFGKCEAYDAVYYSIPDRVSIAAAKAFTKGNKEAQYFQIEDGFYNYFQSQLQKRNILHFLSGCSKNLINRKVVYLYCPELCIEPRIEKRKIPVPKRNNEDISILNRIFGYEIENTLTQRIIYFDTLGDGVNIFSDEEHIKAVETIKMHFRDRNFIVKLHPRRTDIIYEDMDIPVIKTQGIPFELFVLNENMSNKVLVTFWSTAVFAPKIFMGEEPYIILLCKIFQKDLDVSMLSFIERLKKTYDNSDKIMIPESLEEYEKCLSKI